MQHPTVLAEVVEEQGRRVSWIAAQLDPPVSTSTVSRWCNGEREVPTSRLEQLAELLGVSVNRLAEAKGGLSA